MVYSGTIKNGMVVLDSAASLRDGTRVRVEAEPGSDFSPVPGSPQAVLSADLRWDGPAGEVDSLLAEIQQLRDDDVDLQTRHD